jgi:hypothetical protein
MVKQTHSYAVLAVSAATYEEIARHLREAGYEHVFNANGEIDMNGVALVKAAGADKRFGPRMGPPA